MNYFLYTDATSTTGKALLAALKEQGANIIGGTKGPDESKKVGVLIRWGATKLVGKPGKVLNNAKSIGFASDKLESLKKFRDEGIVTPPIFEDINKIEPKDFPVLGRKVHHIAANDIALCLQKKDLGVAKNLGCSYFTKYIPTAVEYRLHVFGDKVIKTSQKILSHPEQNKRPWIRNFDEGYTFHAPQEGFKLKAGVRALAIESVSILGLTFGAVDIIIGDDGKAYVLEVNTAPGLQTDNSIEVYIEQFKAALA